MASTVDYSPIESWYQKLRRELRKGKTAKERNASIEKHFKSIPKNWSLLEQPNSYAGNPRKYYNLVSSVASNTSGRVGKLTHSVETGELGLTRDWQWQTHCSRKRSLSKKNSKAPVQDYVVEITRFTVDKVIVKARNKEEAAERANEGKIVRTLEKNVRSGTYHVRPGYAESSSSIVIDNMAGDV